MEEQNNKKNFLVYYDNEIIVCRLNDNEAGKLFKALFPYGRERIRLDFENSPALAMAFDVLALAIDRSDEKYEQRCKKNRENGRKGGLAKARNNKQFVANGKQGLANLADIDRDIDREKRNNINYQHIADMYNDTCVSFPRLTVLSEKRKKAIKARLNTYSEEDFKRVFEMAESSSFLKGQNSRNWSATFDWLIADANMAKVLDGNYDDKKEENLSEEQSSETRRPASAYYEQFLGGGDSYESEWSGVESTTQTGLLVDYEVEDYGKTASFYLPDNQILDNQINDRRGRSGMPKEYVYKTGNDFDWSLYGEDVEQQKKIANAFIKRFDDFRKQGRGLYIVSNTKGSGKTMLACCIANELLKHYDISVKFISMAEYIELVRDKSEGKTERINSLLEASLLIVDDIGAQIEDKDWISSAIFRLVNRRYENLLPTIYTSNVPIEQLKCDTRAVSRIYEISIKLVMPEKSIRRKKADEMNRRFLKSVLEN